MASKWKLGTREGYFTVSDGCFSFMLREKRQWAEELVELLNEHESLRVENAAMKEERRWRKIGEEWPESGQMCVLYANHVQTPIHLWDDNEGGQWRRRFSAGIFRVCGQTGQSLIYIGERMRQGEIYTHWRPAPTDVPKEEE